MSAPETDIERCARALFDVIEHGDEVHRQWLKDKSAEAVRAVLLALREPSEGMIEAWQGECAGDADEAGPERIRKAWACAIDAALREK